MRHVELLTDAEVRRTHEASLEVLETVGILAHFAPAREVFKKHGCRVDDETGLVRFPAEVTEKYRKMAPPSFTFRGRDPRFDRTIPDDGPIVVTCLLYTSDAADDLPCVGLGGRRILKKKTRTET